MFIHNLDPVLLHLGPLEIRYYGLVYILGFFLAAWWMKYLVKKHMLDLEDEEIWDLSFYLLVGVIIGSRLGMIFWQPSFYLNDPIEILKIWNGGMSFHGGFLGIIAALYWYSKKKNIKFLKLADILSIPAIFALALGRIANFINGELWGRTTDVNWCVVFPQKDELCRHPSQLYAAGKRFVVFGWLLFLSLKNKFKDGFIFWNFILFEGLGRIIVDFYRQDILYYGFSRGQWMSLVMVIVAIYALMMYYEEDIKRIF